jgi:hypothetical protein
LRARAKDWSYERGWVRGFLCKKFFYEEIRSP